MDNFIIQHETSIRFGAFIGVMAIMILLEYWRPRKARTQSRSRRWPTNILLIVIDGLFVRLIFPIIAVGVAAWAHTHGWGLFNSVDIPIVIKVIFAIIILDMMIYWQHVASHHIPILWAFHKVHHVDRDIDVTTGSRFHPLEMGFSMVYKMLLVLIVGAPVIAVIIFEIILNVCAMFNHSNVNLPRGLDQRLRALIVTPDMHRVHHSTITSETNSNYGFSTSIWDKLFKTYCAQPAHGHDNMNIGLDEYQGDKPASLLWSLRLPFSR